MKVKEIFIAENDTPDFVVYKISSPNTDSVYYGYCTGEENILKTFVAHAGTLSDPDRGDVRMINAAGGAEHLKAQIVDAFANEEEAFIERNNQRAQDSASVSGPSMYPSAVWNRAKLRNPNATKGWKRAKNLNAMSAREAMNPEHGGNPVYDWNKLKELVATNPKLGPQLKLDLDKMLFPDFTTKYFSQ